MTFNKDANQCCGRWLVGFVQLVTLVFTLCYYHCSLAYPLAYSYHVYSDKGYKSGPYLSANDACTGYSQHPAWRYVYANNPIDPFSFERCKDASGVYHSQAKVKLHMPLSCVGTISYENRTCTCKPGYHDTGTSCGKAVTTDKNPIGDGESGGCDETGFPIKYATGNKVLHELDYKLVPHLIALDFDLYYLL